MLMLDAKSDRLIMKTLRVLRRSAGKGIACALVTGLLSSGAFAQQTTCGSTVVGRLETVALKSHIFHNVRTLRVWLPPKFDSNLKYSVLYILDGASAFDGYPA